jgi:hypothetical protein
MPWYRIFLVYRFSPAGRKTRVPSGRQRIENDRQAKVLFDFARPYESPCASGTTLHDHGDDQFSILGAIRVLEESRA